MGRPTSPSPPRLSPFVISAAVASIDGVMYPSLAEAVANVTDGQTIKLEANCDETVTVSRTVKFTLMTNSMGFTGSINPGSRTTLSTSSAGTNKTEYSFTYSAPLLWRLFLRFHHVYHHREQGQER